MQRYPIGEASPLFFNLIPGKGGRWERSIILITTTYTDKIDNNLTI